MRKPSSQHINNNNIASTNTTIVEEARKEASNIANKELTQGYDISNAKEGDVIEMKLIEVKKKPGSKYVTPFRKYEGKKYSGNIPWSLLDELEAERAKLRDEYRKEGLPLI